MSASTILLVDDDEVLNQVLRRVLTRDGYTVLEAGSVAQALERADGQRPALGLLDLRLPDGDGVELARQLREKVGRFPLILMTAYPLRLRDQPELAREFAHVLTKPLNLEELRQAIATSLGTAARTPSTPAEKPPLLVSPVTAPAPQSQTLVPMAAPAVSAPRNRLRWAALAGIVVVVAGLIAAYPALGMPGIQRLLKPSDGRLVAPGGDASAYLPHDSDNEIELPRAVADRLGVTSAPVEEGGSPRLLELAGSLAFDPNRLFRVQARFGGEVVELGKYTERDADGRTTRERTLRYLDPVTKGQVLAVVLSKDLGEKKSELIDSLMKLWYDEALLESLEQLVQSGGTPPVTVKTQRAAVALDNNAVGKAELTLRTWRVVEQEIQAVKDEARRVFQRKGKRDLKKETEWAKVEVRAPFDGVIAEKNVTLGTIVDTTFDLFKVANLRKLGVLVHAYEEDLRELQKLLKAHPQGYPWQVRTGADTRRVLKSEGLQQLGLIVDPSQHTDPVMGLVDNSAADLHVGQFVTATVELPAPPNVIALPASAIEENGAESVLFVQPDPAKPRYALRRVLVAMRLRDVVYVRTRLTETERKKGLQEVKPGEYIVTEGVLELKSALEDLQAKAKAQK